MPGSYPLYQIACLTLKWGSLDSIAHKADTREQMGQSVAHSLRALDDAVVARSERAFDFLQQLVAAPSLVGEEAGAQEVVAGELARLGFELRRVAVPAEIAERPGAGVPSLPYDGRPLVVGERAGSGRSLLINGHVDVVPPGDAERWSSPAFEPRIEEGWLYGRGAGDMKSGFAMAALAIEALLETMPDALAGPLSFVSVIEEECTGNGTLAACEAGVLADAVLLPEPSGLELLLDGIGILWFELTVEGIPAHAQRPSVGANAVELALPLLERLRILEREINDGGSGHALNVGTFHAGDWQSSVPATARLGVRLGFPREWTVEEAQARVLDAIGSAAEVRFNGFRAEGYALDAEHELVHAVAAAHADVVGAPPSISSLSATTDARVYINRFGIPALSYGPRVRNMHGIDEAVELASIVTGARVLARFLLHWLGGKT
jgi:acetylornithine deacetylase